MRAVLLALVVVCAVAGGYALLGGGGYEPTPVANPCAQRARPSSGDALDAAQRATLAVLDGAACTLRTSREQALLDVLERRNPGGATDGEVRDAVLAGIDRAQREGTLGGTEATVLRFAVRVGGVGVLLDLLRR